MMTPADQIWTRHHRRQRRRRLAWRLVEACSVLALVGLAGASLAGCAAPAQDPADWASCSAVGVCVGWRGEGTMIEARPPEPIGREPRAVVEVPDLVAAGDDVRFGPVIGRGTVVRLPDNAGGDLDAAMRLGRIVRAAGARTEAVGACDSACAVLWAAGAERSIAPGGSIGLHAPSTSGDHGPALLADLRAYHQEMGAEDLLRIALATPHDQMTRITR